MNNYEQISIDLGFKLEYVKDLAEDEFSNVQIAKISGISFSSFR